MAQHRIASLADCPLGAVRRVVARGEELALARTSEGDVFVTSDICPHGHCSIGAGGSVKGVTLVCPCHGSAFDLATGTVLSPPARYPLRVYAVTLDGGDILVDL